MNGGFESPAQQLEFAAALARREVPLKFAYGGDGSATYRALARSSKADAVVASAQLEIRGLLTAVDVGAVPEQLCDIGPGDGRHTGALIQALTDSGSSMRRYLALDFSSAVLEIARVALASQLPAVQRWRRWDFELGPTSALAEWRAAGPALLVLGGMTLGNADDPLRVVSNLRESTESGDLVLISIGLAATPREAWSSRYVVPPALAAAALHPLALAGLQTDSGTFRLEFDRELSAVIGHFELSRPQQCTIGDETLSFAEGERIRCFMYRRFTRPQVDDLAAQSGMTLLTELVEHDSTGSVLVFRR
jgi:L-histidine N-alpha-methyltransferase